MCDARVTSTVLVSYHNYKQKITFIKLLVLSLGFIDLSNNLLCSV